MRKLKNDPRKTQNRVCNVYVRVYILKTKKVYKVITLFYFWQERDKTPKGSGYCFL